MMSSLRGVTKRIQAIKFALLSPDEIRRMSATKIITADTYDDDGFPIDMGLMDSHLGVIEPGLRCKTCGGKVDDCPGHFGHIDLAMPVIHVGYVKDIKKLLQATCRKCGRLLLTRQQAQEYMAEMEQVEELGGDVTEVGFVTKETAREAQKRQRCPHCGEEQGKVTLDKPTTFREDGHKLTPKEVRERLERIPNEDLRVLGMNPEVARPEWMVLTALLVPPVTVRPSITLESGDRSEDDLTHKLVDVLRINQRLRENRDADAAGLARRVRARRELCHPARWTTDPGDGEERGGRLGSRRGRLHGRAAARRRGHRPLQSATVAPSDVDDGPRGPRDAPQDLPLQPRGVSAVQRGLRRR